LRRPGTGGPRKRPFKVKLKSLHWSVNSAFRHLGEKELKTDKPVASLVSKIGQVVKDGAPAPGEGWRRKGGVSKEISGGGGVKKGEAGCVLGGGASSNSSTPHEPGVLYEEAARGGKSCWGWRL